MKDCKLKLILSQQISTEPYTNTLNDIVLKYAVKLFLSV